MSRLREYVKELLAEAAKGPRDLPADISVKIDPDPHGVTITYTSSDGGPPSMYSANPIVGEVMLEVLPPDEPLGPCGGAWMIGSTHATKGWGPMLYDVAMEYATMNGGGIIADRGAVSPSARNVWDYYMNNRGDVTGIQMDDLKNTLTPEEEDNCNQRVGSLDNRAQQDPSKLSPTGTYKVDWIDSPLSKRWTKPPTTIEALRAAGKLIWQEAGDYRPIRDLDKEGGIIHLEQYIREILIEEAGLQKLFFLIGPPSVGKSTWIKDEGPKYGIVNPYKISMDDVTDMIGDVHGLDYDEMFEKPIQPGQPGYTEDQYSEEYGEMIDQPLSWKTWEPKVWSKVAQAQGEAMSEHDRIIGAAAASGRPIVVDMTNMNKGARERMINQLDAPNHRLIAVVFDWDDDVEFLKGSAAKRAEERFEQTGRRKTIPPEAFDRMVGGYEPPTEGEGWDEIIHVPAWWVGM